VAHPQQVLASLEAPTKSAHAAEQVDLQPVVLAEVGAIEGDELAQDRPVGLGPLGQRAQRHVVPAAGAPLPEERRPHRVPGHLAVPLAGEQRVEVLGGRKGEGESGNQHAKILPR
jgi:hypothetical protein